MRQLVLMVCLALVLLVCSRGGEARVRLNSIRTVILREGHALPMNRSTWEPSLDLTLYQCMSDLECSEGNYCHAPTKGPAHSRCQTCRRRKRRCHRDGMCCPGNRCSNNICVPDVDSFVSQRIPDSDGGMSPLSKKKGWRKRGKVDVKGSPGKGQVGDPCLRSSDCSDGLCCARHFWTRICKPVLRVGQVCTRHRRKGNHGLELFQRCPCSDGLSCRILQEPGARPSSPPSSSLLAAAMSKFAASSPSSRHSSPHTSLLSESSESSSSSAPPVAKTRLHVCQKN
ncbi:dickkopf-related protein 2-like [Siniperca chuatsi]|uniref:dickkopf-related protein 2-like n=1 Tax=Siniperca chuatsi TaxID=119488 RepID=UPI001CE1469A|nr:dickkopf-related protein 2-like [Siniperca chuatsi]XP_044040245.1 dickkopf-related protein 2-like [Siniperca chuatsi]